MEHVNADQVREALLLDKDLRAQVELYVDPELIETFLACKNSNEDFSWKPDTKGQKG